MSKSKTRSATKLIADNAQKSRFNFYWLLALLAFLVYANTIPNSYNLDDFYVTEQNPVIEKGISAIPEIFTTHWINQDGVKVDYRPLVKTSFAIEYQFFGYNPQISHFINILFFILTVLLFYRFLEALLGDDYKYAIYTASILFCLTPVNTEVVASLKNRDEMIALSACLASATAFLNWSSTENKKFLLQGILFFALALFGKVSSTTFILAIPFILFVQSGTLKKAIQSGLFLGIVSGLYATGTYLMLGNLFREGYYLETPLKFEHSIVLRIGTGLNGLLFYLSKMLFPYRFGYYYGYNQIELIPFWHWKAILSLMLYSGIFTGGILAWFRKDKLLTLGIGMFLIQIAFFSNFVLDYFGLVGDRSMFVPFTGFSLILAWILIYISNKLLKTEGRMGGLPKGLTILIILIGTLYGIRTISRNADWKDKLTLFRADIGHLENSAKAQFILAKTLRDETKRKDVSYSPIEIQAILSESEQHYKRATEIYPKYAAAWEGLGMIHAIDRNMITDAIHDFRLSLTYDSSAWKSAFNLGLCYANQSKIDSAGIYYEQTLKINPEHQRSMLELVNIYFAKKEYKKCEEMNDRIHKLDESQPGPYVTAGFIYFATGDSSGGYKKLDEAFDRNLRNQDICQLLFSRALRMNDSSAIKKYRPFLR